MHSKIQWVLRKIRRPIPSPLREGIGFANGLAILGGLGLWLFGGWAFFIGWMVGAAWNIANLFLLQHGAHLMGQPLGRVRGKLVLLGGIKFGLLYPFAIAALWLKWVPLVAFAGGFTAVLIGLVLGVALKSSQTECHPWMRIGDRVAVRGDNHCPHG